MNLEFLYILTKIIYAENHEHLRLRFGWLIDRIYSISTLFGHLMLDPVYIYIQAKIPVVNCVQKEHSKIVL